MENQNQDQKTVICIGDIHGHITKLRTLWRNLESLTPTFPAAIVIFLGDYCDRGPHTRHVIDFLLTLPSTYPNQTHVFLAGNHDFAFAAFVGAIGVWGGARDTWREYEVSEESEGWYKGEGWEGMHLQGRRWGGEIKAKVNTVRGSEYMGSTYDARPTFESYGVPHGSADLRKAMPDEHKKFLADLVWVHEEDDVCIQTEEGMKHCKLIAVHAGLEKGKDVKEQLISLKAKDATVPKVEALCGKQNVWDIPQELTEYPTIVVSGHHGKLLIEGLRLIIDEGGGYEDKPVAAIVLPSMKIVRSTDVLPN